MTHIDEDLYSLEQAQELLSGIYNTRKHEKPGDDDSDKYAYHIGETIHHLRDAISERKAEEAQKTVSYASLNMGDLQIIREESRPSWPVAAPLFRMSFDEYENMPVTGLRVDDGIIDVYQGGSK